MGKLIDLTGQRFGRLVVLERVENNKHKQARWLCRCDCGNEAIVEAAKLKSGHTQSCGCLKIEKAIQRFSSHKQSKTRLYQIWCAMRSRCNNPNDSSYQNYGKRGITVCGEWQNSFEAFREWALSHGYDDTLTIERRDVEKEYSPENCEWITKEAQARNRRNNHLVTLGGKTQTLVAWIEELNISRATVKDRVSHGWPIEIALIIPPNTKRK